MTAYEQHLLGLAYAECDKRHLRLTLYPYPFGLFADVARLIPESQEYETIGGVDAATDEEGLRSLLTGLGVEVPEPPSADQMQMITSFVSPGHSRALALGEAYDTDPLAVVAWLEGLRDRFKAGES